MVADSRYPGLELLMGENYNLVDLNEEFEKREQVADRLASIDIDLHSLPRRLIELRIEHAGLDNLIDRFLVDAGADDLSLRRLKKRRLLLRDQMARIEAELDPPQPA